VPDLAISGQISANAAIQADLTAKIAAFDRTLEGFVTVELAMKEAVNVALSASAAVSAALMAAVQAALGPLSAYASLAAQLAAPGAHAFTYEGQLSAMGTELDAATPAAGVAGSADVRGVLVFVESTNTAAVAGLEAAFAL